MDKVFGDALVTALTVGGGGITNPVLILSKARAVARQDLALEGMVPTGLDL